MDGAQCDLWMGLNLNYGWASTWIMDGAQSGLSMGLNLDYGGSSTWIMDGAQAGLGTGLQPGFGMGLNLDHGWGSAWIIDGGRPGLWTGRNLDHGQQPVQRFRQFYNDDTEATDSLATMALNSVTEYYSPMWNQQSLKAAQRPKCRSRRALEGPNAKPGGP